MSIYDCALLLASTQPRLAFVLVSVIHACIYTCRGNADDFFNSTTLLTTLSLTPHITKGEEISMGIPTIKTEEWRKDNEVLNSDQIEIIEEEDVEDEEDDMSEDEIGDQTVQNVKEMYEVMGRSGKHGMSTASTVSRQGSPQKKQHQHFSLTSST